MSLEAFQKMPRHVLAVYDSSQNADIYFTKIHQRAEIWLNHLGMIVDYQDIQAPLLSLNPETTRAVIMWFPAGYKVPNPSSYCSWLHQQMAQGIKIVILGELGINSRDENKRGEKLTAECTSFLEDFGLDYQSNFSENPYFFDIAKKDAIMVEFERKLVLNEDLEYQQVRATRAKSRVYLQLIRRDMEGSLSDVIFTNDKGGFAMETFVNFRMAENEKVQWRLHPFYFLEEALGIQNWPRPDTTTLDGKRIFFSQIDGDGIFNVSMLDGKSYSGRVVIDEILKKYPKLPVTASIIAGYLDMPQYFTEKEKKLYQDLFSLPNVEPAVHGYAHPLVWKKGSVSLDIAGYHFSSSMEISGANQKLNELLENLKISKKSRVYLWTGDALPDSEALQDIREHQLLNMNGGGGRYDKAYPSYSYLFPLSRWVQEKEQKISRQYYTAFSNENIYTNLWKGPYYGFFNVIESFQNTESPFRLKPYNLYYHYYSGERQASVHALKEVLDYISHQEITPIFASQYIQIVQDFFEMTLSEKAGGYCVDHPADGALRTIRFDHEKRKVDWSRSKAVKSANYHNGHLYISLDTGSHHEIYLKP